MNKLQLISKKPALYAYGKATIERLNIPNVMDRGFKFLVPNEVRCGDIMCIWEQGRWHYLAAVIDLHARRIVGWAFSLKSKTDLLIKALNMAYKQRGKPQNVLFHSDQDRLYGNRASVSDCKDTDSNKA